MKMIKKTAIFFILFYFCIKCSAFMPGDEISRQAFSGKPYFSDTVTVQNCYMINLTQDDFEKYIVSAEIYRPEFSAEGEEIWLICTKYEAESVAKQLYKSYEWQPCDPAETAVFAFCKETIIFAKGDTKSIYTAISGFESIYGTITTEYKKDKI